jgi:hypothetical protein
MLTSLGESYILNNRFISLLVNFNNKDNIFAYIDTLIYYIKYILKFEFDFILKSQIFLIIYVL